MKLAELLDILEMLGLHLKDVTIVGHRYISQYLQMSIDMIHFVLLSLYYSIGAHMAGLAAKLIKSANKVGTIIGLDPTSVGFNLPKSEKRLDHTDAMYVQVIHTDISRFGIANPIGHGEINMV